MPKCEISSLGTFLKLGIVYVNAVLMDLSHTLDLSTISLNLLILSSKISISDWRLSFSLPAFSNWFCNIPCLSCILRISVSAFSLSVSACIIFRWNIQMCFSWYLMIKEEAFDEIFDVVINAKWEWMFLQLLQYWLWLFVSILTSQTLKS